MSPFDVTDRPRLKTLSVRVVFFLCYVATRAVEKFDGAVQTAAPLHVVVDWRVIVQILASMEAFLISSMALSIS